MMFFHFAFFRKTRGYPARMQMSRGKPGLAIWLPIDIVKFDVACIVRAFDPFRRMMANNAKADTY